MNHCYSALTTKQDLASSSKFGSPNHKHHKNFNFKLNLLVYFLGPQDPKANFYSLHIGIMRF